ncbi:MAG: magnesium transporter [Rhizobiales bacterium]|nr:magnesium transporter [Hyphomicrobiales bacterium]
MRETDHAAAAPSEMLRDEEDRIRPEFVARVTAAIDAHDGPQLQELVGDLHEADTGDLIEALDPELRPRLVMLMGAGFDFTALTEVDDAIREEILDELPPNTVAAGVRELDSDNAVYLLEGLPKENQAEILGQLPPPERIALERSLYYPEDSAGRRMQTEFIAVPQLLYVVDPALRLLGSVSLDRLLRTKRPVPIVQLIDEDRRRVLATEDQEEVARIFERYDLVSAPVVDEADRLVGVITVDDIVDVISEEADEDLKALGGVQAEEELSDSVWDIVRSRFPWLFANMLTAFLASQVIRLFEHSLEKMVALAILMPVVASMGGNAGTQTMTVAVRALATRQLSRGNALRVIRREVMVGAMNGLGFAIIMGVIAAGLFQVTDLGLVIGLAAVSVFTAAALGGILIPLLLERLGADPAVSSGPFVTTVTDIMAFSSFLGIATLWFGLK